MTSYWTYAFDGEYHDAEYDSCKECIQHMNDDFAEQCLAEDMKNGQVHECKAEVVNFFYNMDNDRVILETMPITVEYEHYHGDLAEHGTY